MISSYLYSKFYQGKLSITIMNKIHIEIESEKEFFLVITI